MNPEVTSFEDCDLTHICKIIDKETQTGGSFISGSDDSKSSVKSPTSSKLPLPRDLDTDDFIKVYSFCQILQDPECPRSVTLIKDSITEEVRNHSKSKDDAVANRYRYCREVIKPFLKDYPQDCPASDERLVQDAISSASEDFPDYQPCYEFFPTNKAFAGKTSSLDSGKKTSLGLPVTSDLDEPIEAKPKTSNKKCNTEVTSKSSAEKTKVDKSTHCTPKSSESSSKSMDRQCPSKTSQNKSCPGCPGIPVKDCGPAKTCTTKDCPTKKDPNKSCPLRDCPSKSCPLKGCPTDVCPPKECESDACPPEYCPGGTCPPKECPLTDSPPACAPPKCPSLDCNNKSKPSAESSSKSGKDCHSKIKMNRPVEQDDSTKCNIRTEKSKGEVCDNKSNSSIDMKKMLQAHNETIATLKIAMEDFMGKVYKTTQDAVATITNESTKQMEKYRRCESSNTDKMGENKSAETITSFNFVREVESKDKTDSGSSSKDKNVVNQIVRKVESTISVVSETVVDKIPDKLKPSNKFNESSSYDEIDSPKKVSNELIHDPTTVISHNVFTTIKTKICSIFCDSDEKKENSGSKKSSSSCSSSSSKRDDDDKLIERLIE